MAHLLTRAEFAEQIAEMVKTLKLMTAETHRVCPTCLGLHDEASGSGTCWCDYESDWQDD